MTEQKYAVITGASQGIGKAMAMELAARSYNLILVALPASGLEETAKTIEKRYRIETILFETDLSDIANVHSFYKSVSALNLSIHVWVNNAGVGYQGELWDIDPTFFNKLLSLNMNSLATLSRLYIKDLKLKKNKGYLLNVGSLASFFPLPYKAAYAASKSFVLNFSRSLKEEVKGDGIHVSCICPGPVVTNEGVKERIGSTQKAKYFMTTPEKLAQTAIEGMFNKKGVIVPGFLNKILAFISKVVPHFIILFVTRDLFARNKEPKKFEEPLKENKVSNSINLLKDNLERRPALRQQRMKLNTRNNYDK
ncbi:SDR family NAD(P)-dependent oxidoreductase [Cytophagaceae bacterium ABcell3]|nr:SDR family NAD(P)-dependent oxidoreductase [Cytophagaceae bacterium ABcell3]